MKKYLTMVSVVFDLFLSNMSAAQAGFLWFPVPGYYASTTPVVAVPDLDTRVGYIKTRTGETGNISDGCLAYVNKVNVPCDSTNTKAPRAFRRTGGLPWTMTGINYDDGGAPGTNLYLWYYGHTGYDYLIPRGSPVVVPAAVSAVVDINPAYGQVTLDHGNGYRSFYTHMSIVPGLQYVTITRNSVIGYVSSVGASGIHLHFTVKKYVSGQWVVVDPYGSSDGEPILWE